MDEIAKINPIPIVKANMESLFHDRLPIVDYIHTVSLRIVITIS